MVVLLPSREPLRGLFELPPAHGFSVTWPACRGGFGLRAGDLWRQIAEQRALTGNRT